MENTRPILYGVADYAELRKANAWFIDRTGKIRLLEGTRYAVFLRPRRFGKSLWTSILEAYYDVRYAERFDEFFAGTDIGANPTDERGKYLILRFDFSAVTKDAPKVQGDFNDYASLRCDTFARDYAKILPEGLAERILSAQTAGSKLNVIASGLQHTGLKLYVIIDEYDNFTNTILAEHGVDAYNGLCHGEGFFKDFFTRLKAATTGMEAPVTRLFITGVSPVTMDDVTSGFNIGTNISLDPQFADLVGFRHDDLRAISNYYAAECGFDGEMAYQTALAWYDNYRFGSFDAPPVANTTIVLAFVNHLLRANQFPKEFVDENLRTDYTKIRHLITVERRLNGNFHVLEDIVSGSTVSECLVRSFQAKDITNRENFVSLLYWLGITTITGDDMGAQVFGIPNNAIRQIAAQMFTQAYSDACGIDQRLPAVNAGLRAFASKGTWDALLDPLLDVVKQNFAARDSKEGETAVASAVSAILIAAGGPYFISREREANGGFYDMAFAPRFDIAPKIAHAALIEMKYVKAGNPKPTQGQLDVIKAKAVEQLDKYSSDNALSAAWHIGGGVSLHRLVLVFHGGDCLLREEV